MSPRGKSNAVYFGVEFSGRSALFVGFGAVIVVACTGLAVLAPMGLVALLTGVVGVVLVTKPTGRLLIFIAGAMVLFQSTTFGPTERSAFMVVAVAGSIPAAFSARRAAGRRGVNLQAFLLPTLLLLLLISYTLLAFRPSEVSVSSWVRDATTYFLFVVGPIYGLDAAMHASRKTIQFITVAVAFVGAFSFMAAWLSRRGYALGGISQFALASSMVVLPAIVLALVFFYQGGPKRWRWALVAVIPSAMLIATGGRSAVIYLGAAFLVFFVFGPKLGGGAKRNIGLLAIATAAGYLTVSLSDKLVGESFLTGRLDWFSNASFDAVQSDLSGQARLRAYGYMWEAFTAHPLLGNGFGKSYPSVNTGMVVDGTYTLDTPTVYLAKFGLLGTVLMIAVIAAYVRAIASLSSKGSPQRKDTFFLVVGVMAIWVAQLPGGAPTEQKGFGIGMALIVALAAAWAASSDDASVQQDLKGRVGELTP
jgi:hypothetical protein